jgi:pantoate--beta-alanine ligase
MALPLLLETIADLAEFRSRMRAAGLRLGLVPTMGALHRGHLSLVEQLRPHVGSVIVSIFVNPSQFGPGEDFANYPRALEQDIAKRREIGVEAVFAPLAREIYPPDFATTITPGGVAAAGLEDRFRPGHFAGVATIVAKLFALSRADAAIFGEKDFQQLAVIRQMVRDLDLPIAIHAAPTLREPDGLALSSRNAYLAPQDRASAPLLHATLTAAAREIESGRRDFPMIEAEAQAQLARLDIQVEYIAIRCARTLLPPPPKSAPMALRILVAARLGNTRLIDNVAVPIEGHEPDLRP